MQESFTPLGMKAAAFAAVSQNGTDGRVYGGDNVLIHVADGLRAKAGEDIAQYLDDQMRLNAVRSGARTADQAFGVDKFRLCPGCYMIVLFNAAVHLAQQNGQSLEELGNTMSHAFSELAKNARENNVTSFTTEEILVKLDR